MLAAFAFDFDASAWRRDARNLVRLDGYSRELRSTIATFAAEHRDATHVHGSDQTWMNELIDRYARLRGHLGKVQARMGP